MKRIVTLLLVVILVLLFAVPALAADAESVPAPTAVGDGDVSPQAEVTKWYFRLHDGEYQKRLWSVTYGYWITDWMPAGAIYP